jgi:hypothetical protein
MECCVDSLRPPPKADIRRIEILQRSIPICVILSCRKHGSYWDVKRLRVSGRPG